MALKKIIKCSTCGNEIILFVGEKLLENTKCRLCSQPLPIPEEYKAPLYGKKTVQH